MQYLFVRISDLRLMTMDLSPYNQNRNDQEQSRFGCAGNRLTLFLALVMIVGFAHTTLG